MLVIFYFTFTVRQMAEFMAGGNLPESTSVDTCELCDNCSSDSTGVDRNVPGILLAATNGHEECLKALIDKGADVNRSSKNYETALLRAAVHDHNACLYMLIQAGADVNVKGNYGRTALIAAVEKGNYDCSKTLIEAGANVNAAYLNRKTALIQAAWRGYVDCIEFLIKKGADVKAAIFGGDHDRYTALIVSAKTGCWKCVEVLLKAGADVNTTGSNGGTALMEAARSSSTKCVQTLLQWGAHVNKKSCYTSQNALEIHIAWSQTLKEEITMTLLAAGESTSGPTVTRFGDMDITGTPVKVPQCLLDLNGDRSLKKMCREAIRNHLLNLDPHVHLFCRVPKLGLPTCLIRYLLYYVELSPLTSTYSV